MYLFLAGLCKAFWAISMKLSLEFTKIGWAIFTILGLAFSALFLLLSVKHLKLSLAYPIWSGVGAAESVIVGLFLFKEHLSALTLFFVLLLIVSIIGIDLTS